MSERIKWRDDGAAYREVTELKECDSTERLASDGYDYSGLVPGDTCEICGGIGRHQSYLTRDLYHLTREEFRLAQKEVRKRIYG